MSDDLGRVLDRVRKLLALASSPNVHEAAAAAASAQRLVDAYRLHDLLHTPPTFTDGRQDPLDRARRLRDWRMVLAAALADANGCVTWTTADGPDVLLCVAGEPDDRDAVRALWEALLRRIEWLSATHGPGRPKRWHDAFRIGVVDALAASLAGRPPGAAAHPDDAALQPVDGARRLRREAVEAWLRERLGDGRSRPLRVDAAAWRRGRHAAAELDRPG